MTDRAAGVCSGAKAVAASSWPRTESSIRQCWRSFGPPCTIRCPMASGAGVLDSTRSLPIRIIASRWPGMQMASETNSFCRESFALKWLELAPIDSASPQSSISVRAKPTRYRPNLSEEEPLFRARIFTVSACAMSYPVSKKTSCSQIPAPVANLRHVLAMLADIELVALHGRPVTRRRRLRVVAEGWKPLEGVQCELIAVEIVQHNHVERGRRRG